MKIDIFTIPFVACPQDIQRETDKLLESFGHTVMPDAFDNIWSCFVVSRWGNHPGSTFHSPVEGLSAPTNASIVPIKHLTESEELYKIFHDSVLRAEHCIEMFLGSDEHNQLILRGEDAEALAESRCDIPGNVFAVFAECDSVVELSWLLSLAIDAGLKKVHSCETDYGDPHIIHPPKINRILLYGPVKDKERELVKTGCEEILNAPTEG